MKYLNTQAFEKVTAKSFQEVRPYPWLNVQGGITETGFDELQKTLPNVALFEASFGKERLYGQKPHDRFELKYHNGLKLSPAWKLFIEELSGPRYHALLERLFGTTRFSLRFQWQYSVSGCSVSPHCDSEGKIGSHIFYFNTDRDWKDEWGGQTIVLDDNGEMDCRSAPDFPEFASRIPTKTLGNYSLLFQRTNHSWHAVKELRAPEGAMRKIFTVIIERKHGFQDRILRKLFL